jgi:uncharacterized protein YqjF (DUF2071 family)
VSGPKPRARWRLQQSYRDLLLTHWPVAESALARNLPAGIQPALFDGSAWVGRDVYLAAEVALHGPLGARVALPGGPQVTLRALVRREDCLGIFLLDLAVSSHWLARAAQFLLHVDARSAVLELDHDARATTTHARVSARNGAGRVDLSYRLDGAAVPPRPGSLEKFLLGEETIFAAGSGGKLYSIACTHGPWAVAPTTVDSREDSLAAARGLGPVDGRFVTFVQRRQSAVLLAPRRIA